MNSLNRHFLSLSAAVALVLFGCSLLVWGQAPANAVEGIVLAHGADLGPPPISVEMTGTVERGGTTERFRMVATRDEEFRIEYGTEGRNTRIATPNASFRDDGTKMTSRQVLSGFSQLDVTGLFFVQQLRQRAVRMEVAPQRTAFGEIAAQRIRVSSERTQLQKGTIRVDDRVDLYVDDAGRLAGISRTFYENRPERYTQTFRFSNYRETSGLRLPYRIEVFLNGQRRELFQIEAYRWDLPTARDEFFPRRPQ